MPKYVFSYHGNADMPDSEEEMGQVMAAWGAWFASMGEAVVDAGNPITVVKTVRADGSTSEGGGVNPVTGYSIVNAPDMDAAVAMAQGCPVLAGDGAVEVGEAIDF